MTTTDAPEFRRLMLRLDTVFDKPGSAVKVDAYFEELRDIPFCLVSDAVSRHIKRARTYPRPAELRKLADEASGVDAPQKLLAPAPRDQGPPVYHCALCEDNGWLFVVMPAPLYGPDATVDAVKRCACYRSNPNLVAPKRYADPNSDFQRTW